MDWKEREGGQHARSDLSYLYSSRVFSASCLPPVQSSGLVSRYQVACLPLYQSARTALETHSAVLLLLCSAETALVRGEWVDWAHWTGGRQLALNTREEYKYDRSDRA